MVIAMNVRTNAAMNASNPRPEDVKDLDWGNGVTTRRVGSTFLVRKDGVYRGCPETYAEMKALVEVLRAE